MFTQASSLVAAIGGIAMVSLLMSAAALVATLLGDWNARSAAQGYTGEPHENGIFSASFPPSGTHLSAAAGNGVSLTLIVGGCRDDQGRRNQQGRSRLTLVPGRVMRGTATEHAHKPCTGASTSATPRKRGHR